MSLDNFPNYLDLRSLSDIGKWMILAPFTYKYNDEVIHVPTGFETDLASIPKWFSWLLPINDKHRPAAVVHDFLYTYHNVHGRWITRLEADKILLSAMCDCHEMRWRRQAIYWAVRLGGASHWNK